MALFDLFIITLKGFDIESLKEDPWLMKANDMMDEL